jgi:hypothetical protein
MLLLTAFVSTPLFMWPMLTECARAVNAGIKRAEAECANRAAVHDAGTVTSAPSTSSLPSGTNLSLLNT